jgi:outer membrane receptor protein involved in Fe transport
VFGDERGHIRDARQRVDPQYRRAPEGGASLSARVHRGPDRRPPTATGPTVRSTPPGRDQSGRCLVGVLRQDRVHGVDSVKTPRVGLLHTPGAAASVKLIYGHSVRAPSLNERYSNHAGDGKDSLALRSERPRSLERVAEHSVLPNLRALASVFQNQARGLAFTLVDPADGLGRAACYTATATSRPATRS